MDLLFIAHISGEVEWNRKFGAIVPLLLLFIVDRDGWVFEGI